MYLTVVFTTHMLVTECHQAGVRMNRFIVMFILTACICASSQGCTYRAWYTGFQEEQRRKCYDNPNQTGIQQCLDRANMSYDEYNKHREDSKQQNR